MLYKFLNLASIYLYVTFDSQLMERPDNVPLSLLRVGESLRFTMSISAYVLTTS